MSSLHYLTVQDILWINLQVTKKVNHFSFAKLEEATFYQYAYGESTSLLPQAARFLTGFARLHPLEAGNPVTAFVACLAFLKVNGMSLTLKDDEGAAWLRRLDSKESRAADLLAEVTTEDLHAHGKPDVRAAVTEILHAYPKTVAGLSKEASAA